MKKFLTVVMALVLCLSMSMSVCAATNSPGSGFVVESGDKDGQTPWESGWLEVEKLADQAQIKEGTEELSKYVNNPEDYELLLPLDVEWVDQGIEAKFPITVKFKVSGVDANTKVLVLHKCGQHGWEKMDAKVENGTVTVTFHSFSPVLIFAEKDNTTNKPTGGSGSGTPSTSKPEADTSGSSSDTTTSTPATSTVPTSPKTADPGILMAGAVAAASVVGLAATKRRK